MIYCINVHILTIEKLMANMQLTEIYFSLQRVKDRDEALQ